MCVFVILPCSYSAASALPVRLNKSTLSGSLFGLHGKDHKELNVDRSLQRGPGFSGV